MTHSRLQRATGRPSTRAVATRHVGTAVPRGPGALVGEGRARGRPPVCGRRVGADPFHAAVPGRTVDAQASRAVRTTNFGVKGEPAARPPVCGRRVGADPFHAAVAGRKVDTRVSCAGRTTKLGMKGEPAAGRLSAAAVSVPIPFTLQW